jgi:CSLREA domain-containing protein
MHDRTAPKVLVIILVVFLFSLSGTVRAATFNVTKTTDTADGACDPTDCSLREAVIAANAQPDAQAHKIILPAGAYTLTLTGPDEDHAATGDLDIRSNLAIEGVEATTTIIQACDNSGGPCIGIDRVLDIAGAINVRISNITVRNGSLTAATQPQGGGIYNSDAGLILDRVLIEGNATPQDAGGIYNAGNVTLLNSTVRNNHAGRSGGGVFNDSARGLTIIKSTLSGNIASNAGGGIANGGMATLINTTISSNTSMSGSGGGIDTVTGTLSLDQVSMTGNTASTFGGGLSALGGTVILRNTILAGNTAGGSKDCSGALTSRGHNLIGINSDCLTPAAGDQAGTAGSPLDPMLAPLADNGGPTRTHALLIGSPAIDAVDNAFCQKDDQRGGLRPVDGDGNGTALCDIGAYETSSNISVSPVSLSFGSLVNGSRSPAKTIVVSNVGTANLAVGAVSVAGVNGSEFSKQSDACSGQIVGPGADCSLEVVFSPASSGSKTGNLLIPSNDPDTPTAAIFLSGTGTPIPVPNISVALGGDLQVAFGQIPSGTFLNRNVVISNSGTADLTLGNIAQADPLSSPFRILTDGCSGKTIASFANCTLTLRFEPTAAGDYNDRFDIPSNDPDAATLLISVSGTGVEPLGANRLPSPPELISPTDGETGLGTDVSFRWKAAADPDGDTLRYQIQYCADPNFSDCDPVDVPATNNKSDFGAGLVLSGSGLVVVGMVLNRFRRRRGLLIALFLIGTTLAACGGGSDGGNGAGSPPVSTGEISFTASGLSAGTTYSWKVIANDGKAGRAESVVRSFATQ